MFSLKVHKLNRWLPILLISLVGCQAEPPTESEDVEVSRLDTELVLNNAILERSNQQANTVWKIKADSIVYSEDQKTADLTQVVGNLLQDGKIILKISAQIGEIQDNGNIIILNDRVIASDPRNGSVIETKTVEWRPQENLLLIKDNLNGIHPNLSVTAAKGKYLTDIESLEIEGDVTATTIQPALQLKSDRLIWNIPAAQVNSPEAIEIVRYDEDETVTDKLVSDRAQFNLTENIALLNQNIELISLQPPLQIATESLTWDYLQRVGETKQPIQILDRDRQISLTGNQGEINLLRQVARLENGVRGINQKDPAQLYARQLTWKIDTEEIEATGNVVYEQSDPQARLTGEKAVGTLRNNQLTVTSNGKKPVTSVINN